MTYKADKNVDPSKLSSILINYAGSDKNVISLSRTHAIFNELTSEGL